MTAQCESCSMTIESGQYCQYCADESGHLHPFEEVFERFLQWTRRQEPGLSEEEAREKTRAFMATRPAWSGHPSVGS